MSNAEQDYYAEIVEFRAELEQVRAERDEYVDAVDSTMSTIFGDNVPDHYEVGHLSVHVMALLATIGQLQQERDAAEAERDALAHWRRKYDELAAENTRLEDERDAARAAAAAWKRSAKLWRNSQEGHRLEWAVSWGDEYKSAQAWWRLTHD